LAIINGILGALVGVTAGCCVVTPVEAVPIGIVGSFLANITAKYLIYLKIDDAVGATCVHGFGGFWGMNKEFYPAMFCF
jgi:Amt family ammonium transporter